MFRRFLCHRFTAHPIAAIFCGWALFFSGCGPGHSAKTPARTSGNAPRLTVLVVDAPFLGEKIKAEWSSNTESDDLVTIRQLTWEQVAGASRLPGDLIVYPSGRIGELAEAGLLAPISDRLLENDAFALRDIYKNVRLHEIRWGDKVFALPLGSPQFVLVYRSDIFAKLKIEPPQTWAEYDTLAARLDKREELGDLAPAAKVSWQGSVEPWAPGFAGQMLLARSAAYAAHKEQISPLMELTSLQALVSQPPYVRALQEMTQGLSEGQKKRAKFTAAEAYLEIAQGRCAMAITWPSAATTIEAAAKPGAVPAEKIGELGFAELPGAREVYDFGDKKWGERTATEDIHVPLLAVSGRMVSVTATSSYQESAENMAAWLSGSEFSTQISPASRNTTMFRISQEPEVAKWVGDVREGGLQQYVAVLRKTMERPRYSQGVRIPGRQEYLAALDQAVLDALQGNKKPEEALAAAAAAWDKITAGRGLESQRGALQRSLGLK